MDFDHFFVWRENIMVAVCCVLDNGLKFWWQNHRGVSLNPGHDTCFLEQDTWL